MTTGRHTLRDFDVSLNELKSEVLAMGAKVSQSIEAAVKGLLEGHPDRCNEVIADDEVVDSQEMSIDEVAMGIMVRFNPVATDLRMVISSMNAARSLERMGDHAVNIARRARKILKSGPMEEGKLIEPLYTMASIEVKDALTAYADGNLELALCLHDKDAELDRMHKRLAKTLSGLIEERESGSLGLIHLLFAARSLERIGDLAVNIGEEVVFIESAEDIRHK
jgi:phosphate transport system protein